MNAKRCSVFFSFVLITGLQNICAIDSYIDLTSSRSDLADIVMTISLWDENKDSVLWQLRNYIADGHVITFENVVLDALEYAEKVIDKHSDRISPDQLQNIEMSFAALIQDIENGVLSVDRDGGNGCHTVKIREKLQVFGRAKFFEDVRIQEDLDVIGKLHVHGNAHFNNNVTIDGSFSSDNAIFGGDIVVDGNISLADSTSSSMGNVIKDGVSFISTYPAGSLNTFVGEDAGNFTMTGTGNSGFGASALRNNGTGTNNIAVGFQTMLNSSTASNNTAIGYQTLQNIQASNNVALGFQSMVNSTVATDNTALGFQTLQNIQAGNNVAVGFQSMVNSTTASGNTAVGYQALQSVQAGNNVAIGFQTMVNSATASSSTAIGYQTLQNGNGSSNIAIGFNAGSGSTLNTSNDNIYIANNGVDESGAIRIGALGTHTACFIQGINGTAVGASSPVLVNAAGQLGTMVSSIRFKHDVNPMSADSEVIYQLNPVTFVYNGDELATKQYGLIAEEVDQVFSDLVVRDEDGNPYTVQYQVLPALLLNEIKKHKIAIEQQGADFASAMEVVNRRLEALEQPN